MLCFPGGSAGKGSSRNAEGLGSIPGSGRYPGAGKGCPLQDCRLENSTGCIVNRVAKSQTRLSNFNFASLSSTARRLGGLVWRRSPGDGKSDPPQHSGLENPMECTVRGVAQSRTRLRTLPLTGVSLTNPARAASPAPSGAVAPGPARPPHAVGAEAASSPQRLCGALLFPRVLKFALRLSSREASRALVFPRLVLFPPPRGLW